jgi:hypothetical protein
MSSLPNIDYSLKDLIKKDRESFKDFSCLDAFTFQVKFYLFINELMNKFFVLEYLILFFFRLNIGKTQPLKKTR